MWNIKKHFVYIPNVNIHEKLHNYKPASSLTLLPSSLIFKFQLGNKLSNKALLYSNRMLIERVIGQKMIYVKTKKHHPAFNIAKHTQFGCLATCRSTRMFLFFIYFSVYSLRNLNFYYAFTQKYNVKLINTTLQNNFHFGMTKLLYFVILSISKDWDGFSYIYDNATYGVDFSIQTPSANLHINKLILGHIGLSFI